MPAPCPEKILWAGALPQKPSGALLSPQSWQMSWGEAPPPEGASQRARPPRAYPTPTAGCPAQLGEGRTEGGGLVLPE